MALTDQQLAELRRLVAEGGHTQAAMARAIGTYQAAVSRALAPPTRTRTYPHTYRGPIPGPVAAPRPSPPPRPPAVGLAADLERRIADLDATAARALDAGSYTPAVTAQTSAARLRRELEEVRQAEAERPVLTRDGSSDAALIERLVAVVEILPDEAYERLEDAVLRRRGRAREVA